MAEPISVAGVSLTNIIERVAASQLSSIFGLGIKKLSKLAQQDPYYESMVQAFEGFARAVISHLCSLGYEEDELEEWMEGVGALIEDATVADELWRPVIGLGGDQAPDAHVLEEAWARLAGDDLQQEVRWPMVAAAYRRKVERLRIVDPRLRSQLQLEELVRLRKESRGSRPHGDLVRYAARMRDKYRILDLTHFEVPAGDDSHAGQLLRKVFLPQQVREDPPPYEVPRDLLQKLVEGGEWHHETLGEEEHDSLAGARLERMRNTYLQRPPRPVLEVATESANRRLVILGGPGSGKSALTRYLLLTTFDAGAEEPFHGHLPLLIELREYASLQKSGGYKDFLGFCEYLGHSRGYFLEESWLDERLRESPSLVLFDGLDEIFDPQHRDRVAEEIVGFSHRYPEARLIVTSRPVGYRKRTLNSARFRHFALEEFDSESIKTFVTGWFHRTFDDQAAADQRIRRVMEAIQLSPSIRLLAGNPMLLTIMCLIARLRQLPRDRARFYQHAAEVLCHHWDANRGLRAAGVEDTYLDIEDKSELLRRIAYRMQVAQEGAGNFIRRADLQGEFEAYLGRRYRLEPGKAKGTAKKLIEQLHKRNYVLCLRGPGVYGFVHRTFLEYYCAAEVVRRRRENLLTVNEIRDDLFARHWRDESWVEPLRLICGMVSAADSEILIGYLAEEADPDWSKRYEVPPPVHLELAVECLGMRRDMREIPRTTRTVGKLVASFFELPEFGPPHPGVPQRTQRWASERLLPSMADLPRGWCEELDSVDALPDRFRRGNPYILESYAKALAGLISDSAKAKAVFGRLALQRNPAGRSAALQALVSTWPDEGARKLINERATKDQITAVRSAAVQAIASAWPDEEARKLIHERATKDQNTAGRSAALQALASTWPDEEARKLIHERATKDQSTAVRSAAVQAIASAWPDEEARKLIHERATKDQNEYVRSAALQALASAWPDEEARRLIHERATRDQNELVRRDALQALASAWPDEKARKLIHERATKSQDGFVRSAALKAIASAWPDEEARKLIHERATKSQGGFVRSAALKAIASAWPDEEARKLIHERATKDQKARVRGAALKAIASAWPDEEARKFIHERATKDQDEYVRSDALQAIASTWPDEEARRLINERATKDQNEFVRRAALQAIASTWPDEEARKLIHERATKDQDAGVRRAAVQAIASAWPDEEARELIHERATKDQDAGVRRAAVHAIASAWPDEEARRFIHERATKDQDEYVRCDAVQALASDLEAVILSRYLDGAYPFLDPKDPVSEEHISRAAARLGLTAASIKKMLKAYSSVLGWNPLVGTGATEPETT